MGLGRRIGCLAAAVTLVAGMAVAHSGSAAVAQENAPALQHALESSSGSDCFTPQLQSFYAARGYQPLWWDERSPNKLADELVAALRQSADDGLNPSTYRPDELAQQLHDARPGLFHHAWSPDQRAQLEVELSTAFLQLANDLHDGRVNPSMVEWGIQPDPRDPDVVLEQVAQGQDVTRALDAARPTNPGYTRLRDALRQLRQVEANGGWPTMDLGGNALHEGDREDRVLQLRARLRATGELPKVPAADELLYDDQLTRAVRAFQQHHGLEADGVVGADTVRELNVPVSDRIEQVQLNMERWRWMPSDPGDRFVIVNAASFELDAIQDGRSVLQSAVVVGLPDFEWQTPVFADSIRDVDVHPDWHVPSKIEKEELIPELQQDPDAFEPIGIRVIDRQTGGDVDPASIAWTDDSADDYELVQDAGPNNPLGDTRLLMHDALGIYLHGTLNPGIFDHAERDLSHGCIRVEKISELTEWALSDPALVAEYRGAVASEEQARLPVPQSVPVYVTYFTAYVDEEGALNFRPDNYVLDASLQRAIDHASSPSARCGATASSVTANGKPLPSPGPQRGP